MRGTVRGVEARQAGNDTAASRPSPDVNVKFLRSFVALVDEGGSAKAAARLGVPRHRVRDHVAALEKAVGRRLLERQFAPGRGSTDRAHLTEDGRAFLPKAVEVLRAYDRMFDVAPIGMELRERSRATALGLLELALAALRHDLPDDDEERIDRLLR